MNWQPYYSATKDLPPNPLLVKALEYVECRNKALDLGAGALKDTRFLLENGFEVIAVDKEPVQPDLLTSLSQEKLTIVTSSFEEFAFPLEEFDLINAISSLPFTVPEHFDKVFKGVKNSLKKSGIFCGHLFGIHDEWFNSRPHMKFHTKEQVVALLSDLEILHLDEVEHKGKTATGTPKHWHTFKIIAIKK